MASDFEERKEAKCRFKVKFKGRQTQKINLISNLLKIYKENQAEARKHNLKIMNEKYTIRKDTLHKT